MITLELELKPRVPYARYVNELASLTGIDRQQVATAVIVVLSGSEPYSWADGTTMKLDEINNRIVTVLA